MSALGGLTAFVTLLGTDPHPDAAADGLLQGPLTGFDGRAATLYRRDGRVLRVCGRAGSARAVAHHADLAFSDSTPISEAAREQAVVVGPGNVIGLPVTSRGASIGAVGVTCGAERTWTPRDVALLEGVSGALGLWLTLHDDPLPRESEGVALTPRQARILSLVLQSRTTTAIATSLGYSPSTVKQDVHNAIRLLGATSRTEAAQRALELGLLGGSP
jgi:DNA-binding CsgD family transcriptional regulator